MHSVCLSMRNETFSDLTKLSDNFSTVLAFSWVDLIRDALGIQRWTGHDLDLSAYSQPLNVIVFQYISESTFSNN